jgi:hemerythrin
MTDTQIEWDDSFLIGIEELDFEHKVLINDINRLHLELARQDEKSEIEKCLGDIYARMQAHFALEEHVMKEHQYRFFDEHKREHERLLDSYSEYMMQILNNSAVTSSNSIEDTLRRWVLNHIFNSDKKMSLMVQELKNNLPNLTKS